MRLPGGEILQDFAVKGLARPNRSCGALFIPTPAVGRVGLNQAAVSWPSSAKARRGREVGDCRADEL